jgi:hypothetical protein
MTAPKSASAPNTPGLLPGRTAARRLHCTSDHVAKLCREGKLSCLRRNNAWFVERDSIEHFRQTRQLLRAARSEELARLRRHELGLLDQSQAQPQRRPPAAILVGLAVVAPLLLAILVISLIKPTTAPATPPSDTTTTTTAQ